MKILTFDVEDWFHLLENDACKTDREWKHFESRLEFNMDKIFRLLDDNNQDATFFCLGWIVRKHPRIIDKIDSLGYEIGTHSDMHQLLYRFNKKEFINDLENSIKSIEDIIGKKVISYRAPGFSIKEENLWVFDELMKQGIERDCSVFSAKRAHGGFAQLNCKTPLYLESDFGKIKEFPMNLYPLLFKEIIFSGGGYFRVLPYPLIKYFMEHSEYVMSYFHPRDFDSEQPMMEGLNLIRKFKSYYGLSSTLGKLERAIKDFNFVSLKEADGLINWEKVESRKFNNLGGVKNAQNFIKRKSTLY